MTERALRAFKARFDGVCVVCHKPIEPGQWVVYTDDHDLTHEHCDEEDV